MWLTCWAVSAFSLLLFLSKWRALGAETYLAKWLKIQPRKPGFFLLAALLLGACACLPLPCPLALPFVAFSEPLASPMVGGCDYFLLIVLS